MYYVYIYVRIEEKHTQCGRTLGVWCFVQYTNNIYNIYIDGWDELIMMRLKWENLTAD